MFYGNRSILISAIFTAFVLFGFLPSCYLFSIVYGLHFNPPDSHSLPRYLSRALHTFSVIHLGSLSTRHALIFTRCESNLMNGVPDKVRSDYSDLSLIEIYSCFGIPLAFVMMTWIKIYTYFGYLFLSNIVLVL